MGPDYQGTKFKTIEGRSKLKSGLSEVQETEQNLRHRNS